MARPLRILIVEDSEDDAMLVLRELRRAGFEPAHKRVQTIETMTAALVDESWEIIVSDYSMPNFSGLAALKAVRQRNKDVPFILVSGTVGEDVAVEAMRLGAQDYIMKDNLTRLVPAIERELHDAESRRKRQRAEEGFRETQRVLFTLLSNLQGMAYRCRNDRERTMEFVSEGCLSLTGYHTAEVIGNYKISYGELVHPDDRETVWREVQVALKERRPFQVAYRIRAADGAERWVLEQGCGVFTSDGQLGMLEGFISDITARRLAQEEKARLEAQLQKARQSEAIGQLAGVVDHELSNMLDAFSALCRRLKLDESASKEAAEVQRSLEHSARLIRERLAPGNGDLAPPKP